MSVNTIRLYFLISIILLLGFFILNISLGSVSIPFSETLKSLFGKNTEQTSIDNIIKHYRLPKAITAVLTGSCLVISGLLMKTLFKNTLLVPYDLSISSYESV